MHITLQHNGMLSTRDVLTISATDLLISDCTTVRRQLTDFGCHHNLLGSEHPIVWYGNASEILIEPFAKLCSKNER